MNSHYGLLDDSLQNHFSKAKTPPEMLKFIKKYVIYSENESKRGRHLFLIGNPLEKYSNYKLEMKEFNTKCLSFLINTATSSKNPKWSSESQAYLGVAYELGLFGLEPNGKNAFSYYSVAAQQNNEDGTFRVGQCYEKGIGRKQNISNAIYFYRCSAKLGSIFGLHTYGSILLRGELDTPSDFDTGLFYLKLATKKTDESYPYTYYDLGQIYESRTNVFEVEPDDDYAFRLYEKGANLNCPNSQYRLARAYETGELFQKVNMKISIEYYFKSANNGQIDAQYALSRYLFIGIENVLEQDLKNAYLYALKAASRGQGEAAFTVGEFIETGCGTKKRELLALWWYTISSNFGNKKGQSKMANLRYEVNMKDDGSKRGSIFCCL
ncbi:Protein SKT5 [Nosema bombycis CQ1]|jgi:hypothetical protein|uniref:Protein SKT5 n=1 Tax=Nosema bombycis (strain CQ1 / CVCC 102059) TaxID=578461 RepID=R0KV49_NOSB1|nr:Protein SKT5 [Nosema bombycis CQ1]|eukprot:EOB14097.1 Protein SKT5 [Nosema bombycis CQ1]